MTGGGGGTGRQGPVGRLGPQAGRGLLACRCTYARINASLYFCGTFWVIITQVEKPTADCGPPCLGPGRQAGRLYQYFVMYP